MVRIVQVYIQDFSAWPKESKTLFRFPKSRFLSLSGAYGSLDSIWTGSDRNDQDCAVPYLAILGMPQGFRNTFRISKKSTFKPLGRVWGA